MSITSLLDSVNQPDSLAAVLLVLKITAILVTALAISMALHRAAAATRHLVWLVALAGLLALPAVARTMPLGLEILPASTPATVQAPAATDGNPVLIPQSPATAAGVAVESNQVGTTGSGPWWRTVPLPTLLLAVWGAVALLLVARLLHGAWAVHRIVRRSDSLDDPAWQESLYEIADRLNLDKAPVLLRSGDIHMPFAAGMVQPVIVLPDACEKWSAEQREAVLIHELGHISRRDIVGHTLGRLTCALYWFHPMVWTAARRLRDASERACDDLAIRLGATPSDYAQHLLDIVTTVRNPYTPTAAIAMARRKEFEGRMLAILDPSLPRGTAPRWRSVLLSTSLAFLVVMIGAAVPVTRAAATAPDSGTTANRDIPTAAQESAAETGRPPTAGPESPAPIEDRERAAPLAGTHRIERAADDLTGLVSRELSQVARQYGRDLAEIIAHPSDLSPERMDRLIAILRDDSSAEVRRVAAWGLEQYAGRPAARTALIRALASDNDARVRTMAAWAMAEEPEQATLAALRTAASGDQNDDVVEMAIWALGSSDDAGSASVIAAQLASSKSEEVHFTAAWALGQIGVSAAPPALIAMLQDVRHGNRTVAAWALSEIGDSKALPAISRALEQPQESTTMRALVRAMRRSGGNPDQLLSFLSSMDDEARLAAVRELSGAPGIDPWPWPWPRPIPFP
ncbi:MAG TPA: M56 family metallopeptidase [Gemmatimonadales bacterium]|nr:M56 family metallopeptidase [Gemmatimonadales bacterium]